MLICGFDDGVPVPIATTPQPPDACCSYAVTSSIVDPAPCECAEVGCGMQKQRGAEKRNP